MDRGFSEEECQSEGLFLLLAGSESTANTLRSIPVHTMSSLSAYKRLTSEVEEAMRTGEMSCPI
jgi:cytochrome P450